MYNEVVNLGIWDDDPECVERRKAEQERRQQRVQQILEEGRRRLEEEKQRKAEHRNRSRRITQAELLAAQRRMNLDVDDDASPHVMLGQIGEELATDYLRQRGYYILERNWNLHRGCELDIVARKDGTIYFVEVKTRHRAPMEGSFSPFRAINFLKTRHLRRAANYYRAYFRLTNYPCRFLAIGIIFHDETNYQIEMRPLSIQL